MLDTYICVFRYDLNLNNKDGYLTGLQFPQGPVSINDI